MYKELLLHYLIQHHEIGGYMFPFADEEIKTKIEGILLTYYYNILSGRLLNALSFQNFGKLREIVFFHSANFGGTSSKGCGFEF